jgi:hypothetical protein
LTAKPGVGAMVEAAGAALGLALLIMVILYKVD